MIKTENSNLFKSRFSKLRSAYQLYRLKQQYGPFAFRYDTFYRQSAEIFFVSYPKSGRTWVRFMLAKYLELYYKTEVLPENIFNFTKAHDVLPSLSFTHDGSSHKPVNLTDRELSNDKSFYFDSRKVVLLVRDPRDTVVSYFHHASSRKNLFNGSISEFIRSNRWGIEKIIAFLNNWADHIKNPKLLFVRYEDMKSDDLTLLREMISFIGAPYDEAIAIEATEFSKFDKMKSLINSGQIASDILTPTNQNPNSAKVRKGLVSGYKKELNKTDIEFVNEATKKLNPVFGYSL